MDEMAQVMLEMEQRSRSSFRQHGIWHRAVTR